MVKTIRLHAFGGPENLQIDELESRVPERGTVRLRVGANAISRDQFTTMAGQVYSGTGFALFPLPATLGYEAAGVVEEVGEGVDPDWIGKKVAPIGPFDTLRFGTLGEEAIVPADRLIEYPDSLTPAQAASIWVPFLTAFTVLADGKLKAGDYLSVPAGTSSVGLAAIQLAQDIGAIPIAVTRSKDKADRLTQMGIEHVIITETDDYVEKIMEITNGKGADVTFDPIGGPFLEEAAAAAAYQGTIIEYGILSDQPASYPVNYAIGKGLVIKGFAVSELVNNPEALDFAKSYIMNRIVDGRLAPTVAAEFKLEDFLAAYGNVKKNDDLGRVTIVNR